MRSRISRRDAHRHQFAFTIGSYGVGIWLPLILKGHELTTMQVGWVSSIPYLFATAGMLFWARVVDRTGPKIYNLMAALILGAAGLALSVMFTSLIPALICLTLALVGTISARTCSTRSRRASLPELRRRATRFHQLRGRIRRLRRSVSGRLTEGRNRLLQCRHASPHFSH